ncbi:MAG: hypothetical protein WCE29_15140 [Mycobacterium sp.]|jgi:hypothetical protein
MRERRGGHHAIAAYWLSVLTLRPASQIEQRLSVRVDLPAMSLPPAYPCSSSITESCPNIRIPMPGEDCYAALVWLAEHATDLESIRPVWG